MKKFSIFIFLLIIIAFGVYYYYKSNTVPQKETPKATAIDTGLLKLASWNIRIFSNERSDSDLRHISNNLIKYDFIALLELRDEDVLKRTQKMLAEMGRNYDYQISDEVGRGVKERYAFLYDKSKVVLISPGAIYDDRGDDFIREPYYASFKSGNFDFTTIVTHIVWGDSVSKRRKENQMLAVVYKTIQDSEPSEQDVILMGDFNREPNDDEAFSNLRAIQTMKNLFDLPNKTVIFDSSLYDNIWFQTKYVKEYNGNCGIDKFDERDFSNDDNKASLAVSDHRLVWAEFDTSTDDD